MSRLRATIAQVPASLALVAAGGAVLFFDVTTSRIFEPEKAVLVRSLALAATAAWLYGQLLGARTGNDLGRSLAGRAAVAFLLWNGLATLLAPEPSLALWGSFHRAQGLYGLLAYAALAFFLSRRPAHHRTLLELLALAGALASSYALWQRAGLDPLPWGGDIITRPSSTLGNPIFLGAFLAISLPLTLALFLGAVRRETRLLWGLFLFLQGGALTAAASRGPLFGGLAGVATVLLLLRGTARGWAVGLMAAGFLLGSSLGSANPTSRLGDPVGETGQVRVLIWEGTVAMLRARPERLLTGYGPEGLLVGFPSHAPPALGQIEDPSATADRAHNGVWEVTATLGLPGLGLWLFLWGSLLAAALRSAGYPFGLRQAVLWIGGALAGLVAGWAWGGPGWMGPGLTAGAVGGWLLSLIPLRVSRGTSEALLPLAAAGGLSAHWAELTTGLPIVATSLSFWLLAGLLAAGGQAGGEQASRSAEDEGQGPAPRPLLAWAALGVFLGTLLPLPEPATWIGLLPLLGLMALLAAAWSVAGPVAARRAATLRALLVLAPLVIPFLWGVGRLLGAVGILASPSHTTLLLLLGLGLGLGWLRASPVPDPARLSPAPALIGLLPIGAALLLSLFQTVALSEADALYRQGQLADARSDLGLAGRSYLSAARLDPDAAAYYTGLARTLTAGVPGASDSQQLFLSAQTLLQTAAELEPYNPEHQLNLGRLHRAWMPTVPEAQRDEHLEQAIEHFRQAAWLKPASYAAHHALAELLWQQGKRAEALEEGRIALRLSPPDERIPFRTLIERWEAEPHR